MHVTDILARTLDDPDAAGAVMAALARETEDGGAHLDAEQVAAAIEGHADPRAVAHALRCAACADQLERTAEVLGVDALPRSHRDPLGVRGRPPALFATLRHTPDGGLEVSHATGALRIEPAVATRSPRRSAAVTLRDRPTDASLEVGVISDAGDGRLSVLVRWIGRPAGRLRVRATSGGRLLAERELDGGTAVLSGLRGGDVRVDVVGADRVVGVAWLRVVTP